MLQYHVTNKKIYGVSPQVRDETDLDPKTDKTISMKKNLIVIAIAIILVGISFYAGKFYADKNKVFDFEQKAAAIDSLEQKLLLTQDSLRQNKTDLADAVKVRVIYQQRYDTIRVVTAPADLIKNLTQVINTPPE